MLGMADLGALAEETGGAGEGAGLDPVELPAQLGLGGAAGVLGDAGEQERKTAVQPGGNGHDPLPLSRDSHPVPLAGHRMRNHAP